MMDAGPAVRGGRAFVERPGRAVGGLMGELVILVMPGSRAAVELAMTRIILPELPHIVREARKPGTIHKADREIRG